MKTFVVSHDGVVHEKDLGPGTESAAGKLKSYNPDKDLEQGPVRQTRRNALVMALAVTTPLAALAPTCGKSRRARETGPVI